MNQIPKAIDTEESSFPLAKRRWRLIAVIIDGVVVMLAAAPLIFYFDVWETIQAGSRPEPKVAVLLFVWGAVAFILLNYWLLGHRGQTIGKWCTDTAILGMDGEEKTALHLLTRRYLPTWIASPIPIIGGLLVTIDSLFIFGNERRCIHDRIAGSKVIDIEGRTG